MVEILTQAGHLPSKDWLALVKTSRARNKIKHVINTTERAKAIEIGEKYLEREARRLGVQLEPDHESADGSGGVGLRLFSKIEDLHAALGYGKYSARQVLQKLAPDQVTAETPQAAPVAEPSAGPLRRSRQPGRRSGSGHQGQGHRRPAGLSRQVLQSDSRRSHRRLRDARQGRRGAFAQLHQCPEPDVRGGAQDRRRVGARRQRDVPGEAADPYRGPARMLNQLTHGAVQRADQYPQPGSARRRRTRDRRRHHRHDRGGPRQEAAGARGLRRSAASPASATSRESISEYAVSNPSNEPEHIAISKSKGIKIDWKDGHHSEYALAYLRDECPCATCTGAHGTAPQKTNYAKAANCFRCSSPS